MQISNNAAVGQSNPYALAQTRDPNPLIAGNASRLQPVQPQTANAVTASAEGLKADSDRKQNDNASEAFREAEKTAGRADAPGTRRGSLIDIVA